MLSEREREVLQLAAEGFSVKETAVKVGLVTETVKNHRSSLLRKLGARNVTQAVHHGHSLGLLDMSAPLVDTLGEPTRDFDHEHVGVLARAGLIAEAASFTRAWLGA